MISSAQKTSLPDIIINGLGAGATSIHQGRVPLADNVPALGAAGKGYAIVTGTTYAYDGTSVGYRTLNWVVYSGAPPVVNDDSFNGDATVPTTTTLALDARNNANFTVQNTGPKVIDVLITDLQVRYVGT